MKPSLFGRTGKKPSQPQRRTAAPTEPQLLSNSSFRMNQTLSSRRTSHPDQTSGRSQIHSLTAHRRKIYTLFGLILGIIILLTILLTQFTARVAITGSSKPITQSIMSTQYQAAINDYYGTHPAERLRFLLNEAALSAYVAQKYPEVARVQLRTVSDIVEADFTLHFREPIAGWQINTKQYYVDPEGVVFQKNYYAQPSVQIVDESGVTPEQGATVASSRLLGFVGRVVASAGERGYVVSSVTLPSGTTRQLNVRLDGVGGYVRFTIDRGVSEQVEDMARVITYLKKQEQTSEYIDVRTEGKAVYR